MDLIKDIVTVLKLDKPLILQRDFYDIPRYYLAFLYFVILLITNWIGYLQWYTVMLVGFIIPFVYILTGNKLNSYWQYLAILLWFRTYCSFLQSLDGIFILLLWHPSFEIGLKIQLKLQKIIDSDTVKNSIKYFSDKYL